MTRGTPRMNTPLVSLSTIQSINTAVIYKPVKVSSKPAPKPRTVRPREADSAEKLKALMLLQDGASYQEVGRTLGRYGSTIANWFPGYQWTNQQKGAASALARKMRRVERLTHLQEV